VIDRGVFFQVRFCPSPSANYIQNLVVAIAFENIFLDSGDLSEIFISIPITYNYEGSSCLYKLREYDFCPWRVLLTRLDAKANGLAPKFLLKFALELLPIF
jgi:hypothetical protein